MARRKVITKEQILDAAYDFVAQEGFQKFTARNIATHMGCSTQPIYLEYKNMEELKEAVVEKIRVYLTETIFVKNRTGDSLVDMGLNYIYFSLKDNQLYRVMFLEDYGYGEKIYTFAFQLFEEKMKEDEKYAHLTSEEIQTTLKGVWIAVTGLASLMHARIVNPTEYQIIELIQQAYDQLQVGGQIIRSFRK